MTIQRDLLEDFAPSQISPTEARFKAFDRANPHIWELFVGFTLEIIGKGAAHYSARDILPLIRWKTMAQMQEPGAEGWKVNNNWSPYYARKFHALYPQHKGFFELRTAAADDIKVG